MSVSINFEIPVVTSGRTPGTKTLRALTAYLTVAVDVLSIDPEEAPVAATVKNQECASSAGIAFDVSDPSRKRAHCSALKVTPCTRTCLP